jgi:hypothetical protein
MADTGSGVLTKEVLDNAMRDALYVGLSEEQKLALDQRMFGVSITKDGKRVPPWTVS